MEKFMLPRSNNSPISFNGRLLAECGEPESVGKYDRWHEVRIYKSESGKYVASVNFKSNARNSDGSIVEPDRDEVLIFDSPAELILALREFDPVEDIIGYPEGIYGYVQKQAKLECSVADNFETRLGIVLQLAAEKEPKFSEEI